MGGPVTTERFDDSFYATAAQVIPVLLLTLVFELRIGRRREDEEFGLSIWLMGTVLAMALGELAAFVALAQQKNLSPLGQVPIWLALIGGTMMIAAGPMLRRWEAVHAAVPLGLSLALRYGLLLALTALVILATFGVVSDDVLPAFGAVVVLLIVLAAILVSDFGPRWRRRRGSDDS